MVSGTDTDLLRGPMAAGVPPVALAVYGRWWQLETYLREIIYTELRAAFGVAWLDQLGNAAEGRIARDKENSYMRTADADDLLAYADARVLFALIESHWRLFDSILLPESRWKGLVKTLSAIRNRSAHCRRPHANDLDRLEMALRDLEHGARTFYTTYNSAGYPGRGGNDPLERAWIDREHEDATRLVRHCEEQHEIQFRLGVSARPWATRAEEGEPISSKGGYLWQAEWLLAGAQDVSPGRLWSRLRSETQDLLVHLLMSDTSVTATFASVDDAGKIAAAIGEIFDRIVDSGRQQSSVGRDALEDAAAWQARNLRITADLPSKAQFNSVLCMFDPHEPQAFSIFSA